MKPRWIGSLPVTLALAGVAVALVLAPTIEANRSKERTAIEHGYRIHRHGRMPPAWAAATRRDSTCWRSRTAERGFARKINSSRETQGKSRLRLDPELSKAARKHTKEMIGRNLLHHTTEPALRRRVTFWSILGENVGVGATVDSLHIAFMNSPAHRDNIMHGSFRHFGVGTVSGQGRLWVTVIFESTENPGTTLRMPRC